MTADHLSTPIEYFQPTRRLRKSTFRSGLSLLITGVLFTILIASCASTPTPDPISVVLAANASLNQDDVDGYLDNFSDNAVVIDTHGTYEGLVAIREFTEQEIVPQNYRFELRELSANGNDVAYTYDVYINDILRDTSTDGLDVVVDGKIIFEGTGKFRSLLCISDPEATYCPKE